MTSLPYGLGHACLLDGNGGVREFDPAALNQWSPDAGPLWLHFDLTDPAAQDWLREHSGLDEVAVEALLEVDSRPRLTPVGKGALLAFRGVNLNERATPDDMIGVRIWLEEGRVLTSYRRQLRSVDDVIASLEAGEGPSTAAEVVVFLARQLVLRMSETVDNMEELIDDLEEELIEGGRRLGETRRDIAHLRRQLIALRRYLAPQREALSSLIASKFAWLDDAARLSLRETADRLIRHLEDLDAIRERAAVTQEELQNRLAEQQNVRMYVLSIVAAIFLPLGFLTGLLGINVGGIPGSDNPAAFGLFALFLGVVVLLEIVFFRLRKWF